MAQKKWFKGFDKIVTGFVIGGALYSIFGRKEGREKAKSFFERFKENSKTTFGRIGEASKKTFSQISESSKNSFSTIKEKTCKLLKKTEKGEK